jgi:hypothetical protein
MYYLGKGIFDNGRWFGNLDIQIAIIEMYASLINLSYPNQSPNAMLAISLNEELTHLFLQAWIDIFHWQQWLHLQSCGLLVRFLKAK